MNRYTETVSDSAYDGSCMLLGTDMGVQARRVAIQSYRKILPNAKDCCGGVCQMLDLVCSQSIRNDTLASIEATGETRNE